MVGLQIGLGLRSMAFFLALLPLLAVHAQTPSDSTADRPLCTTVTRAVLAADPPGDERSRWQSPVLALDKASAGTVGIDADGWRAKTKDEAQDRLRREYRAEPGLLDAIGKLTNGDWLFSLYRFGGSSLRMAKIVEGSASCERFVFFDAPEGRAAHAVVAPPVVQNAEPFAFCYRTKAHVGEVAGTPTFIVETDQDNTVELSLTPWRDGGWQRQCRLIVRFHNEFQAADQFCKGVDCREMAAQALALVKTADEHPPTADQESADQGAQFKAMKDLAALGFRDDRLPTFGGTVRGNKASDFASNALILPVVVGGKTYLARVGHPAIGWRTFSDYLFAAYTLAGHGLEPVAGLYIAKTRGRPISATAD
jgi:hypothetical protein